MAPGSVNFVEGFKDSQHFQATVSVFQVDLLSLSLPDIPIRKSGIDEMYRVHYSGKEPPESWPDSVRLVVDGVKAKPLFKKLNGDELLAATMRRASEVMSECEDCKHSEAMPPH